MVQGVYLGGDPCAHGGGEKRGLIQGPAHVSHGAHRGAAAPPTPTGRTLGLTTARQPLVGLLPGRWSLVLWLGGQRGSEGLGRPSGTGHGAAHLAAGGCSCVLAREPQDVGGELSVSPQRAGPGTLLDHGRPTAGTPLASSVVPEVVPDLSTSRLSCFVGRTPPPPPGRRGAQAPALAEGGHGVGSAVRPWTEG